MDFLNLLTQNLLSPPVLFFVLGIAAGFVKSDLDIPESISRFLGIYLMMAIGFKGGVALAATEEVHAAMILTIVAGVALSFLMPFVAFALLRSTTKLDGITAAAVAAHYGSISMVTFVSATSFLQMKNMEFSGYIVAIVALMEAPAIFTGLYLARRFKVPAPTVSSTLPVVKHRPNLAREILTNGAILLLMGSFCIGFLTGDSGMHKVEGFFVAPFQGILCLFLLDMGLLVSRQLHHLKHFNFQLISFGIYMPLIGATLAFIIAFFIGLDVGTAALFMVLAASASYIAVPAAMRLTLPQAKAGVYVPMALAITFPFNITAGIPLYYAIAEKFL